MGQPSGGWEKSKGDEKKREGVLDGCEGVSRERSLCVKGPGASMLRCCEFVCSRAGQLRHRCRRMNERNMHDLHKMKPLHYKGYHLLPTTVLHTRGQISRTRFFILIHCHTHCLAARYILFIAPNVFVRVTATHSQPSMLQYQFLFSLHF